MAVCPRCDGKGYVKEKVRNGICFKCEGFGDHAKYEVIRKTKEEKQKTKDIQDLKIMIAQIYKSIANSKLVKVNEGRRKQAKIYYNQLKKHGVNLTVEEIKEIVKVL